MCSGFQWTELWAWSPASILFKATTLILGTTNSWLPNLLAQSLRTREVQCTLASRNPVEHCAGGFILLQHIIETITKAPIHEATRGFLDACGMSREFTFAQETELQIAEAGGIFEMASGYMNDGSKVPHGRKMFPAFAAGAHGTPRALLKFLEHLAIAYSAPEGSGPISHATARSMIDSTVDLGCVDFMAAEMGLGVFVGTAGENRFLMHQAANDGHNWILKARTECAAGFRGLFMVCFDGPDAADGPKGFVLLANGDNNATLLNCDVTKAELMGSGFSGFDWYVDASCCHSDDSC